MNDYGAQNWEELWEKLEQEGNVGLDYVISPVLYSEIINYLSSTPKAIVADFGCGTNLMGIQLLFGYQSSVTALKNAAGLNEARFNTLLYLGLEGSTELVRQSNNYLKDIGSPKNIATIETHIDKKNKSLFSEHSIDLCVSRNFLMHLSNEDLENHLKQVCSSLKKEGKYIFAMLNPEYELKKAEHLSVNGERYSFAHGKNGEYGTFYHYYRTERFFDAILDNYFSISNKIDCIPVLDTFKNSHSRYYEPSVPMAKVYVLTPNL
jgi:SAM-dependent methyltransferase